MYKMNLALYASILPAESSMHRAYRVTMAAPARLCAVGANGDVYHAGFPGFE
jgi:hypothetical protein